MSTYRILLPILIIMLVFGLLANLNGDTQTGVLRGLLTDSRTGDPVANATIKLLDTEFVTQADANGVFQANPGGLMLKCPTRYEEMEAAGVEVPENMPSSGGA